jgi:hypothetical protein
MNTIKLKVGDIVTINKLVIDNMKSIFPETQQTDFDSRKVIMRIVKIYSSTATVEYLGDAAKELNKVVPNFSTITKQWGLHGLKLVSDIKEIADLISL